MMNYFYCTNSLINIIITSFTDPSILDLAIEVILFVFLKPANT